MPGETPEDTSDNRDWTMIEVASAKGVAYQTVWRAIARGRLPCRRVGRTVLIPAEAVAAWNPCYDRVPHRYRNQPRQPRPQPRRAPPRLVLLANAETTTRERLGQVLDTQGIPFVTVADSEAAVAEARRQRFTHIFVDVQLPHWSGPAALRALRDACPSAIIAFVTGYPTELAMLGWPAAWPVVIIPKPFDVQQIVDVLRLTVGELPSRRRRSRPGAGEEPEG